MEELIERIEDRRIEKLRNIRDVIRKGIRSITKRALK